LEENAKPHVRARGTLESEVDRVYRLLKNWLVECQLAPGQFLSEVELARRCETSRTPIREAANRLAQDGWLSRIRQKGYLVTPVSITDLLHLYEYRKLLECFAAEKTAQVATAEQLETLAAIVAVEHDPKVGIEQSLPASDPFHIGIAEIAGNQWVIDQLKLTLEYVHRLDTLSARRDRTWVSHAEIVTALRARKPADARLAMGAHIDNARERMLRLFAT
jgi:GntR family transcriptional regulator, rspAB operon transcriptional repressor